MRGIRPVPNTGIILSGSILNGADTRWAGTMTRIFITATIAARGEVGIEDSRAPGPPVPGIIPREAPLRAIILRELPIPGIVPKVVPVPFLGIVPREAPLLDIIPKEAPLRGIIPREALPLDTIPKGAPPRAIIPREAQAPLLRIVLRPRPPRPAVVNQGHLLLMMNIISSS